MKRNKTARRAAALYVASSVIMIWYARVYVCVCVILWGERVFLVGGMLK